MNGKLDQLISLVGENFRCTAQEYPEMKGMTPEQAFQFTVRHVALHYAKTAGKIIASAESAEHGGEIDREELKSNVMKSLVNALKMAETIDMSEAEIVERIECFWD